MKRVWLPILCSGLILVTTGCAAQMPWDKNVETESTEETLPPTLEETLGFTAYDLMAGETTYNYQKLNLQSMLDLTVKVKNRNVIHQVSNAMIHEADEDVAYDVITHKDITGDDFHSTSILAYYSKNDAMKYFNTNYTGWTYEPYENFDEYYTYRLDTSKVTVDTFEQQGDRLYVNGQASGLSNSSFDSYIKDILSEYGISDCSYEFRAVYDSATREMIMITADVNPIDGLTYEDNPTELTGMSVSVTPIVNDNESSIDVPEYVYKTSGSTEETQETQEELTVEQAFNYDTLLCESLFGITGEQDVIYDVLANAGINAQALSDQTGLDGQTVLDEIAGILITESYKSFTTTEVFNLTPEQSSARQFVESIISNIPAPPAEIGE